MFEIGRLCVKIAGRDSGNYCVIIDVIDENNVMIDGNVRRKKCNIKHLEPIDKVLKIKKGASTTEAKKAISELGIKIKESKLKRTSKKKTAEKPKKESKK